MTSTKKKTEDPQGLFWVGTPGLWHSTPGTWITDEERHALEKIEWYVGINVRIGDGSWVHMPVDQFNREYDLAHMDPERRSVQDGTFVPFSWLVGARVGY